MKMISITNSNKIDKRHRTCCCQCGIEYFKTCQRFAATDDPRGGDPIRLDLTGSSEVKMKWRKIVIKKLNMNENEVRNWKQLTVMRHHWSVDQLYHFFGGPSRRHPPTPMPCSAINKIAHTVERSISIKRNGHICLFNAPNYPHSLAKKDSAGIEKEQSLNSRCEELVDQLDRKHAEKVKNRGNEYVKNFTYNHIFSLESKISNLETENSQLKKENLDLAQKIEQLQSKISNAKIEYSKSKSKLSEAYSNASKLKTDNSKLKKLLRKEKENHRFSKLRMRDLQQK